MTDEELIARLRACANGNGSFKSNQGDYGVCDDAADRIEALSLGVKYERALRIASDAASAAAYEAAAQTCDNVTNNNDFTRDIRRTSGYCAERIRALATPDQTAALDRVRAEAKAEGIREASEHAAEFVHRRLYEANMPACSYHSRDIKTAILAAIPKEGV